MPVLFEGRPSNRLISLDVFRGATVAAMVIVNNPGDWDNVYPPLLHAEWNGWTPTDSIFPFFLFIVGVAIMMSTATVARWGPILRRTLLLLAFGWLLAGFPRFAVATWRIPGVLQRIALCYLAAVGIFRLSQRAPRWQPAILAGATAMLLAGYWALMMLVPHPGGAPGDLTPDGNLGAAIDRALMSGHLWRPRWDPEGLLSTLPAIATTLFGVMAGLRLRGAAPSNRIVLTLALWGTAGIAIGLLWGGAFPINKSLWTSSYAVFTAGAASVMLAACYWLIEVRGFVRWTRPFVVLGANAVALFVLSGLFAKTLIYTHVPAAGGSLSPGAWIYRTVFVPLASPRNASLLFAAANLALLYGVLAILYRRRLFLRV